MPKHVVSATLKHAEWNNTAIISGDIAKEVRALRERIDGDVLVNAGAKIVQTLIDHVSSTSTG